MLTTDSDSGYRVNTAANYIDKGDNDMARSIIMSLLWGGHSVVDVTDASRFLRYMLPWYRYLLLTSSPEERYIGSMK